MLKNTNRLSLTAFALLSCALWGIATPIAKLGYEYIDLRKVQSLLLWAGLQFTLAGILTILFCSIVNKRVVMPKRKSIFPIIKISLFQTVLQYTFLYVGLLYTTAVKGSVLKSTDVFFIMLISSLIYKQEKLTLRKVLSCVIGFAGIIVINLDGLSLDISPLGDGLVLLAIVCYSFSVIITKRYSEYEEPINLSGYQMFFGGIVMTVIGLIFNGSINLKGALLNIFVLSVIYALSYTVWTILLKKYSASEVAIHSFTTPIFGVIFSTILLKEQNNISPINLIIALILVCSGIIVWSYKQR